MDPPRGSMRCAPIAYATAFDKHGVLMAMKATCAGQTFSPIAGRSSRYSAAVNDVTFNFKGESKHMMPVTQIPAYDASQLPAVYFSREPPGGGSTGGGKRPGGKPAAKPKPKKATGGKTSKKRK